MYTDDFSFDCIRIDGFNHKHDVVINRGDVRKGKKKPSKQFRKAFGHTRLSIEEPIRWKYRRLVVGLLVLAGIGLPGLLLSQVLVNGNVSNGSKEPVGSARVKLEAPGPGPAIETTPNREGGFYLNLSQSGEYLLSATAPGFHEISRNPVQLVTGTNFVSVELTAVQPLKATIEVYPERNLSVEHIASSQTLNGDQITSIPATRSGFLQNMIAVMPGVVKDRTGNLHFHGSPSEEINWLLDGLNVADPASGRLEADLSVEAVKSLDLFSGRYSVEFGKGSGGTMLINSATGDNAFKLRTTNFIPGLEQNKGLTLSSWRPKLSLSGPIKMDRIWFFNGSDLNLKQNIIAELPKGQDRGLDWAASNLLRIQANLSPSHVLSSDALLNYFVAPRSGLSTLDPVETTLNRRACRYFVGFKDQVALSSNIVLELGYGAYRSTLRDVPQGQAVYQVTPSGRKGNFPVAARRAGRRDQWRASAFLPSFNWVGSHQFTLGMDLSYSRYSQHVQRTGYEYYRVDGSRAYSVSFSGNGKSSKSNLESAAYLQDRWAIRPWLLAEAGIRWDKDRVVSGQIFTPRFSFSVVPPRLERTKFSAGFGLVPATTYLRLFARDLDQYSISTRFGRDGKTTVAGPTATVFVINKDLIKIPKATNLSIGVEQSLTGGFSLQAGYLRKRTHNGYTFVPSLNLGSTSDNVRLPAGQAGTVLYELRNLKRDRYDSVEICLSNGFLKKYDWTVSYTRSRAYSNAALDISVDDPIVFSETAGRLPWDTPNRLLSWGLLPITKRNTLAYFLEWHDGFPFSVNDDEGRAIGKPNSWTFPRYFSLNLHYERKAFLLGNQWAVRVGVDNVTNRGNFTLVNNNISSLDFLQLYGRQPRKFVLRIQRLEKDLKKNRNSSKPDSAPGIKENVLG